MLFRSKLDCSSEDLIQLITADGNNQLLVISFKDIASILESCFTQLSVPMGDTLLGGSGGMMGGMMMGPMRGTTPPSTMMSGSFAPQ